MADGALVLANGDSLGNARKQAAKRKIYRSKALLVSGIGTARWSHEAETEKYAAFYSSFFAQDASMKAKEVHDLLLSLFFRGLGIWILYGTANNVYTAVDLIERALFPVNGVTTHLPEVFDATAFLIVRIALAAYFILGAPPFLKWATRDRP